MLRIAVLVSGGGTNLQAVIDRIEDGTIRNTEIAMVISNNKNAKALERAENTISLPAAFRRRILKAVKFLIKHF